MTEALISFRDVGKRFANGTEALRGLNAEIRRGEFVSLLGPSGCGKSTALRLIAGLGNPSQGEILWRDSGRERRPGFVFQDPTLMPWARVFDNVYLPLRLKGVSRAAAEASVNVALTMVGLGEFAQSFPRELSGGMKMRVSIARAIVTDPALLLMDEPFAALDEITRNKLNNDVLKLWRERRFTAVFVTHSVFESVFLSSRILVMAARPGRIVSEIEIDAPYPRDEAFRTSAAFAENCRRVSAALEAAMASKPLDLGMAS